MVGEVLHNIEGSRKAKKGDCYAMTNNYIPAQHIQFKMTLLNRFTVAPTISVVYSSIFGFPEKPTEGSNLRL